MSTYRKNPKNGSTAVIKMANAWKKKEWLRRMTSRVAKRMRNMSRIPNASTASCAVRNTGSEERMKKAEGMENDMIKDGDNADDALPRRRWLQAAREWRGID